ncbi:hypothetical protein ACAW74_27795 [Fibrella sp. WM1]|uniref:argonaute/piwi family protein n=1 Tax=Fibrella musci TaxID=3242485 RepID=UPI0035228F0F
MKLTNLPEPLLEFGNGNTSICPKDGIRRFGPYDIHQQDRPEKVVVGVIGKSDSVDVVLTWLSECKYIVDAKPSKQSRLFPSFMGFQEQNGFCSRLVYEEEYIRRINNTEFEEVYKVGSEDDVIESAVELYVRKIKWLSENKKPSVILCVVPESFVQHFNPNTKAEEGDAVDETSDEEEKSSTKQEYNFRRMLKARAMKHHIPIQIIRDRINNPSGEMQDKASIAWNLFTALYYKAAGTPWSLIRPPASVVCYAGISFYQSRDRKSMQTSIAQIFNELGKGVILRGEDPIHVKKNDPVPHLTAEQSYRLMNRALAEYRESLHLAPQRLVVHKTSNFTEAEQEGIVEAARENRIDALDMVTIHQGTTFRLFREERYPPVRGTLLSFDEKNHLLYSRGSVPYFETYPGQYIPNPLQIRLFRHDASAELICNEILGLTKMNWNNTQFDRRLPITIECARKVGDILKYLPEGDDSDMELRYSFYM